MARKLSIDICHDVALQRGGGKCLSQEYINARTKMKWQCSEGHIWFSDLDHIKNGNTWCPYCRKCRILNPLHTARKLALQQGGKCLSAKYVGVKEKLKWKCSHGHIWHAPLDTNYLRHGKDGNDIISYINLKLK